MSTTLTVPVLWSPQHPNRCACSGTYRPKLNDRGKLVKKYEPAYQMAENTRSNRCLQAKTRACAKRYQLGYQHHADSRKADAGYPDVHVWAPDGRGSVFIELKKMDKNPSEAQERVMGELIDAGHAVYLVRPCCQLSGVLDQIMAGLAGVEPYDRHTPPVLPAAASVLPVASELATPRPPRPRRPARELPGTEPPQDLGPAVGYLVPMAATSAVTELEDWLRSAGFPPASVPFPIRIIVADQFIVQVSAPDGSRVWRGGRTRSPFPTDLIGPLRADVIAGPDAGFVRDLIERAVPNADLPEQPLEPSSRRP